MYFFKRHISIMPTLYRDTRYVGNNLSHKLSPLREERKVFFARRSESFAFKSNVEYLLEN